MANHNFLLTVEETAAVKMLTRQLDDLSTNAYLDPLLLGPIPVTDDGGFELLGFMKQDDDLTWRFTRDLAESLSPLPTMRINLPEGEEY